MTFVCPEIQPVLGDLLYLALRLCTIMPQCFLCTCSKFLLNASVLSEDQFPHTDRCRLSIRVMEFVHCLAEIVLMVHPRRQILK